MNKNVISIILCLILAIGMGPKMVFAATPEACDNWDGSVDTSWYNDENSMFYLTTAEQLAGLAALVNEGNAGEKTFENKIIYLDVDINLSDHEWVSIGNGFNISYYFGGTFNGQGHCVYNLTSKEYDGSNPYHGLFGVISSTGTVQNLGVVDADIKTSSGDTPLRNGILADWVNNSKIINCFTTGTVESSSGEKLIGGLVGQCTGSSQIIGCYSTANVRSVKALYCDTVGGLIGQWEIPLILR